MDSEWVIGRYTGDRAKSVKAHADAGIGYFVRTEEGRGTAYTVTAAFRRAKDSPLPPHLDRASHSQQMALDDLQGKRSNRRKAH